MHIIFSPLLFKCSQISSVIQILVFLEANKNTEILHHII